jgi:molybdate transport system substrate-binding protein
MTARVVGRAAPAAFLLAFQEALLLALAALALAACEGRAMPESLRVAAAASLRELVTEAGAAFAKAPGGLPIAASFDASSTLARQIRAGAAFDVFLSADRDTATRIRDHLVAGSEVTFLRNALVVIGAPDLADAPQAAADLLRLRGKLALAGPAVPAGVYARAWLRGRGLLAGLEGKVVSADNVRAAVALVESGAADAGVVYATDARICKRARLLFEVSAAEDPGVAYVAAAVRGGAEAVAGRYLRWLGSADFQEMAQRHGFLPPK